jgi:predicted DNA binding CopG/RHH family protein
MTTDREAEDLLEEDLSELLTSQTFRANFSPVSFEFAPKDTMVSIRLSKELLDAIKLAFNKRGIGYQKFIRESIERALQELR